MAKTQTGTVLSLVLALVVAACSETRVLEPDLPDGCYPQLACQVSGVDLVVELAEYVLSPARTRDPARGKFVLQPGEPFGLVVRVWNRGDQRSLTDTVSVMEHRMPVPELMPGEVYLDTIQFQAPGHDDLNYYGDETWLVGYLTDWRDQDPLHLNDVVESERIVVALPIIRATLEFPDTIYENVPFTATVTLTNSSTLAAFQPRVLTFCTWNFDVGCGSWAGAPFHLEAIPLIPPGGTWTKTLTVTYPPIDERHYADWTWELYACIGAAGAALEDLALNNITCIHNGTVVETRGAQP